MLTPPSFTIHLLVAAAQGDEGGWEGTWRAFVAAPHEAINLRGTRKRRCHPSRRNGIKDVLPRQLIIRYLHMRTCNLYPSRLPLPRLLALPSKCISQAEGEQQNSLAEACLECGCAQLELYTRKGLCPHTRVQSRYSKHKFSSSVITQSSGSCWGSL